MIPQRYAPAQSSVGRKSRIGEGKPSMLPKPRRPGSTDRQSTEARRPSTAGHRSSSAEPARNTFGGGRLSREASATKLPINGRTPSEDRKSRSLQTRLDRALAFQALASRGGASNMTLVRPLTIARFVDIVGALLATITRDAKLNNDNYSWLKAVNTLHAFPHALALIAYLLDLVNHIYLRSLQAMLGIDDERIAELQQLIKKYETCLHDETERASRGKEARFVERHAALLSALRAERAARRDCGKPATEARSGDPNHKKTLDSCVEYKQGLIHLSAQFPHLASLAIDEKWYSVRRRSWLSGRRRRWTAAWMQREQQALEEEVSRESSEAAEWSRQLQDTRNKLAAYLAEQKNYDRVEQELDFWGLYGKRRSSGKLLEQFTADQLSVE
ncbi:putative kinetochore protein NDC80-like protein, partial [Operophtera brumata]